MDSIRTEEAEEYIIRNTFPFIEFQQYVDKSLDCSAFIDFMRTGTVSVLRELYKMNRTYIICLKSELEKKPNTRGTRNQLIDEMQVLWEEHEEQRMMRLSRSETRRTVLMEIMLTDGERKAEEQVSKWKKDIKEDFRIARKGAHLPKGKLWNKKQTKEFVDAMIAINRVGRKRHCCVRCTALLGSTNNAGEDLILLSKHRFRERFSLVHNVLRVRYYYLETRQ